MTLQEKAGWPKREFTADAMENTKELNQKAFTAFWMGLSLSSKENWIVVAVGVCLVCIVIFWRLWKIKIYAPVTAEKNVATVDRLRRFVAVCFWANRMVGTPTSTNTLIVEEIASKWFPISIERSEREIRLTVRLKHGHTVHITLDRRKAELSSKIAQARSPVLGNVARTNDYFEISRLYNNLFLTLRSPSKARILALTAL